MSRRMTLSRSSVFDNGIGSTPQHQTISKSALSLSSSATWNKPQRFQGLETRSYQQNQFAGSYIALANAVMKKRIVRLLGISTLSVFLMLHILTVDSIGSLTVGMFSFVRLLSLLMTTGVVCVGGVAPLLILKRLELSRIKTYGSTRLTRCMGQVFSTYAGQVGVVAGLSGLSVWMSYCLTVFWSKRSSNLGPFVSIQGRDTLQYNERPFYLAFMQFSLIVITTVDYLLNDFGRPHMLASPNCSKIGTRLSLRLSIRVPRAIRRLCITIFISCLIYLTLRFFCLPAFVTSSWSVLISRSRMVAISRENVALSVGLNVRVFMQGLVWSVLWEEVHAMWDIYQSHPWQVVQFGKDPNKALIDGLLNSKTRHMALLELTDIATFEKAARQVLFNDVRSSPRSFNIIARECLKMIGTTYRSAQARGSNTEFRNATTTAAAAQHHTPSNVLASKAEILNGSNQHAHWNKATTLLKRDENVFCPESQPKLFRRLIGLFVSFLSSSPPAPASAVDASCVGVESHATHPPMEPLSKSNANVQQRFLGTSSPSSLIPEILLYPSSSSTATQTKSPSKASPYSTKEDRFELTYAPLDKMSSQEAVVSNQTVTSTTKCQSQGWLVNQQVSWIPNSVKQSKVWKWINEEQFDSQVEKCIPEWKSCVLAVEALTRLLASSLSEDSYGVAQSEIPRTLEALVILSNELDNLERFFENGAEVGEGSEGKSKVAQDKMREAVWECVRPLQSAVITGISVILTTFEESLHEIKFPPTIARRLQQMLDSR